MEKRVITITRGNKKQLLHSKSSDETFLIAKKMGQGLRGGDVIALGGELGAGKTIFAKGIAAALGIKETVASPTFVLMMRYGIPKKHQGKCRARFLYHIDTYRLASLRAVTNAGIAEHIGAHDVITLIEWPQKMRKLLPKTTIDVSLAVPEGI